MLKRSCVIGFRVLSRKGLLMLLIEPAGIAGYDPPFFSEFKWTDNIQKAGVESGEVAF